MYYIMRTALRKNAKRHIAARAKTPREARDVALEWSRRSLCYKYSICDGNWHTLVTYYKGEVDE